MSKGSRLQWTTSGCGRDTTGLWFMDASQCSTPSGGVKRIRNTDPLLVDDVGPGAEPVEISNAADPIALAEDVRTEAEVVRLRVDEHAPDAVVRAPLHLRVAQEKARDVAAAVVR